MFTMHLSLSRHCAAHIHGQVCQKQSCFRINFYLTVSQFVCIFYEEFCCGEDVTSSFVKSFPNHQFSVYCLQRNRTILAQFCHLDSFGG